jgi:hypothetical protein
MLTAFCAMRHTPSSAGSPPLSRDEFVCLILRAALDRWRKKYRADAPGGAVLHPSALSLFFSPVSLE